MIKRKKKTHSLMKSKIVSLSKNTEFKSLINGKKISNKYSTIFFKRINDKNINKLNISSMSQLNFDKAINWNKHHKYLCQSKR